jgi:hypothetical protein
MDWVGVVIDILTISMLAAFVPGRIAEKKGYSFGWFWLFGVFFFIIVLPVSIILPPRRTAKSQTRYQPNMTGDWEPITAAELGLLIDEAVRVLSDQQRELFESIRVALRPCPIEREGKLESVYVLGEFGGQVLFYEDVEEGFEFARLDADGVIREYFSNQFELRTVLQELIDYG